MFPVAYLKFKFLFISIERFLEKKFFGRLTEKKIINIMLTDTKCQNHDEMLGQKKFL